jgi:hypothetical protein
MKVKSIEVEALVVMFVIAMGKQIGEGFTYFPKLPSCFTKRIGFPNRCYADFLCLRVNSDLDIECWFIKQDKETFCVSFDEIKSSHAHLFAAIITHVCDMIENIEI